MQLLLAVVFVLIVSGVIFHFYPDETAVGLSGLVAAFAVHRVAVDYEWADVLQNLCGFCEFAVIGLAIYAVRTRHAPEGTVVVILLEARNAILMGIGAIFAAYVFVRDANKCELGWKTWLKVAAGGALVAAGAFYAGYLPDLKQAAQDVSARAVNSIPHASVATAPAQPAVSPPPNAVAAFVITKQLNVRGAPNASGAKLKQLDCGEEIQAIGGITSGWTTVLLSGNSQAYVASRYLSYGPPTTEQCQM
jgi:hypothetical protein